MSKRESLDDLCNEVSAARIQTRVVRYFEKHKDMPNANLLMRFVNEEVEAVQFAVLDTLNQLATAAKIGMSKPEKSRASSDDDATDS